MIRNEAPYVWRTSLHQLAPSTLAWTGFVREPTAVKLEWRVRPAAVWRARTPGSCYVCATAICAGSLFSRREFAVAGTYEERQTPAGSRYSWSITGKVWVCWVCRPVYRTRGEARVSGRHAAGELVAGRMGGS